MRQKLSFKATVLVVALLSAACCSQEDNLTILDVAAIYDANESDFSSVRHAYPGPFGEFFRIPARNPSNAKRTDTAFLKELRQNFPVEYIDFFPLGDTDKVEIDVIISKYDIDNSWMTVSLIYTENPVSTQAPDSNMAVFENCDESALEWFDAEHDHGTVSAFCRINEYWYAFQRID